MLTSTRRTETKDHKRRLEAANLKSGATDRLKQVAH